MRIVFVTSRFYPSIGGVQKHTYEVAIRLVKRGHEVIVVTETDKQASYEDKIDGVHVYYRYFGHTGFLKKFRIWIDIVSLLSIFKQADIVHCHDVFFWYFPIRLLLPQKPVYTTFHGYETVVPPQKKAVFIRRLTEMLSQATIAIGDYIQKWYGTHADIVMYGGIDTKLLKQKDFRTRAKKVLRILLIGRLSDDIGIQTYIDVCKSLKKNNIAYQLDILGDGALRKDIEAYGTMHGFVKVIGPFVAKSDIIFTSSYLTIFEALAQHKKVIAVYENKLKEDYLRLSPLAEFIYIDNKSNRIANHIIKTQTSEKDWFDRKKLGTFLRKHTWDEITSQYMKLWEAKV